jgi:hypothetical protein
MSARGVSYPHPRPSRVVLGFGATFHCTHTRGRHFVSRKVGSRMRNVGLCGKNKGAIVILGTTEHEGSVVVPLRCPLRDFSECSIHCAWMRTEQSSPPNTGCFITHYYCGEKYIGTNITERKVDNG